VLRAEYAPQDVRYAALRARTFGPEEARRRGLLDELVAPAAVLDRALEVARDMAGMPADSYARIKRQVRQAALERIEEVVSQDLDPMLEGWLESEVCQPWCRERAALSLGESVRRLTSEPADVFGIPQRGRLVPGAFADVNVIDFDALELELPEYVSDFPAGAGRWTQRARGYAYTLVNGEIVIEHDRHTGRLPGRLVRATRAA